ncbi:MAG: hypothetical protein ACI9KE_006702 [Polyangiales bacterium]
MPATDPKKTPGVKRIMGLIATKLHEGVPGSRFGKTNLQDFLGPAGSQDESRPAGREVI